MIGILAVTVFAVFGLIMFRQTLTPYVSFRDARSGSTVQVAGTLVKDSIRYLEQSHTLIFHLKEKDGTDIMQVSYTGSRPNNFEEATSIVAIGFYAEGTFKAEKLLVKCPSKYQGTDREYKENKG